MTLAMRVQSFRYFSREDFVHAFNRFKKTFVYSAVMLTLLHALIALRDAADPLSLVQTPEFWQGEAQELLGALLTGAVLGLEKASRAIEYR